MIGFIVLSPRSSQTNTSRKIDAKEEKMKFCNIQSLNTTLFRVFRNKNNYQKLPDMQSFIEGMHLSITAVNAPSEEFFLSIDGLPCRLVLGKNLTDDPAPTHYITLSLFLRAREARRHAHRDMALTAGLRNIGDQFTLGRLMGIKQVQTGRKP